MIVDATFWVAIAFIIFIAGLVYLKVPQKINSLLNNMIEDIRNELDEAEKLKKEAKNLLNESQEKLENAQIENEQIIKNAEKEIKTMKLSSIKDINTIAIETSSEIVRKIVGTEVNASSVSAFVEDISKKEITKYI